MERFRYDQRLSTGVVAAGGTLGILIPPSTGFVIYAILTEQSIGLSLARHLPENAFVSDEAGTSGLFPWAATASNSP